MSLVQLRPPRILRCSVPAGPDGRQLFLVVKPWVWLLQSLWMLGFVSWQFVHGWSDGTPAAQRNWLLDFICSDKNWVCAKNAMKENKHFAPKIVLFSTNWICSQQVEGQCPETPKSSGRRSHVLLVPAVRTQANREQPKFLWVVCGRRKLTIQTKTDLEFVWKTPETLKKPQL